MRGVLKSASSPPLGKGVLQGPYLRSEHMLSALRGSRILGYDQTHTWSVLGESPHGPDDYFISWRISHEANFFPQRASQIRLCDCRYSYLRRPQLRAHSGRQ